VIFNEVESCRNFLTLFSSLTLHVKNVVPKQRAKSVEKKEKYFMLNTGFYVKLRYSK
jgi:hypothetical protein